MALDQPLAAAAYTDYATGRLWVEPLAGNPTKGAVGVFSSRLEAEYALHELRDAGFNMNNVSVVAKDADRGDEITGVDMSSCVGTKTEGATTSAATGGAVGGPNRFISRSWRFS